MAGKAASECNAGIAHYAVVTAMSRYVGAQCLRTGCAIGYIELQDARLPAERDDLTDHGFCFVTSRPTMHDDIEAISSRAQCDGAANASAGTGDENRIAHAAQSLATMSRRRSGSATNGLDSSQA